MRGISGTGRCAGVALAGGLLLLAVGALMWRFGGPDRDLFPGSNSPSADLEHAAADLALWPFGAAEKRFPDADAGRRRLAFLRREVGREFPVPDRWRADLEAAHKRGGFDLLAAVNALVNEKPYVRDRRDEWKPPTVFLAEGGDCDCFSAAKYVLLRGSGVSAKDLRITLVMQRHKKDLHVVLVARTGPGKFQTFVLDNKANYVLSALYSDRYVPLVSLNEHGVWLHDARGVAMAKRFLIPSE